MRYENNNEKQDLNPKFIVDFVALQMPVQLSF
jgi:hypothetical protein